MTDPVELALELVGKDREFGQQREHIHLLSAKFSALNNSAPRTPTLTPFWAASW